MSLDAFTYIFGQKMLQALAADFLLVISKNYMSSACLVYQIQCMENSWLHSMTDFNKICYHLLTEFLTLENVQPQQIHKHMIVIYTEDAPSYAMVKHWAAEFHRGEEAFNEPQPGRPSKAICEENCRAVENTVLQNFQVNVQLMANIVGISSVQLRRSCMNIC